MNNYSRVIQGDLPRFFNESKFTENQTSEYLDVARNLEILRQNPDTPIWNLKLIINRYQEDDFDDKKKDGDNGEESEEELDESQQRLLELVNRMIPTLLESNPDIDNKKFKKRGLRYLVELEQSKLAS